MAIFLAERNHLDQIKALCNKTLSTRKLIELHVSKLKKFFESRGLTA